MHFSRGRSVRIAECEIVGAGRNGISLESVAGEVTGNTIAAGDIAIFSIDARGLRINANTINGAGNGGILVWRSTSGDDGTLIIDNRVENISNKSGGSGEWGNAINVFRADNVIVRGNRIRAAAFSAVRGNAASNLQIVGNTCTGLGEVALYAEFGFEGALIANNIVDGAALGVSVTNFNKGGRLAVVQGNLIRNLVGRRPAGTDPNDSAGIGIGIEADTVVTGNVVENAPNAGIAAGWGAYLRDVAITSNVIRRAEFGITVSVAPGAGAAVIADNMISDSPQRRHRRHGMEKSGDGRSRQGRRRPLRAIVDRRQPRALGRDPEKPTPLSSGSVALGKTADPRPFVACGSPHRATRRQAHPAYHNSASTGRYRATRRHAPCDAPPMRAICSRYRRTDCSAVPT